MTTFNITIYRLTATTDDITTTDKIVFNTASKNTRVPNAFILGYKKTDSASIGDNQAVAQDTGNLQHLGKIEDLYTLYGYISSRTTNPNTFLDKLKQWDDEPKVNVNWKNGRFGIKFDEFYIGDVVPVRTGTLQIGLMWVDLEWDNDFRRTPLHAPFTLRFKTSRSDGT